MSREKTHGKLTPTSNIDGMITLIGLKPFDDIDIVFTGMRPGEKLFEELNTEGESRSEIGIRNVENFGFRNFRRGRARANSQFSILNFELSARGSGRVAWGVVPAVERSGRRSL
jgi:hypothetical protein